MRSYAVLGTGAVGGLYGGWLAKAGFPVRFLARSDLEHLRRHGLEILSPRGGFRLESVEAYGRAAELPPCDVVLVAWKTTSNAALAEILPRVLKPGGVVLVLQNGLHPESEVQAAHPSARIVGGLCFLCARKIGPGLVEHQDYGSITLAPYPGLEGVAPDPTPGPRDGSPPVEEVAADFRQAGVEIRVESDWKAARWKKLVWNIPFNGMTALLGVDTAQILARKPWREVARVLMAETLEAAQLDGVEITGEFADKMLQATQAMRPYEPSMKLDRDAGRPMELQAIYGDVLTAAAARGGDCPSIRMLHGLLSGKEAGPATA